MAARLAPKVKGKKPVGCGGQMDDEMNEVLADALDNRHKSADGFREDLQEAFDRMPEEQKAHAAAVCRDLGNEAMGKERWEEAAGHYTSVLAAFPHDHEVLANRSLAHLHMRMGPEALNDAALAVNLKPNFAKGYYRMGCALEECKMWKESAAVFAKVVEMEPSNVEASGRLIKVIAARDRRPRPPPPARTREPRGPLAGTEHARDGAQC